MGQLVESIMGHGRVGGSVVGASVRECVVGAAEGDELLGGGWATCV
jgi:hypothetical protein